MKQGSAKKRATGERATAQPPAPITESELRNLLAAMVANLCHYPEVLNDFLLLLRFFTYETDIDARENLWLYLEKEAMPMLDGFDGLVRSTLAKTLAARRREWGKAGEA